jgi:hypothetical protein
MSTTTASATAVKTYNGAVASSSVITGSSTSYSRIEIARSTLRLPIDYYS